MKQFLKTAKGRAVIICAAILLIGIAILLFLLLGGEAAYRSISISEISGKVIAENNSNSYEAYENMVLGGGYSLTTSPESYTRMLLDSDKYMKLEERSCARFESLGSPKEHRTAIRLDYGALSTEITAPLGSDEDFVVNTPNAVLAVRGTFFRVEVSFDTNGDAYTDVYTYGGAVACRRVMPDGTMVDEDVVVGTGYKARIKMDEIITIYVEELIEESSDNVDPLKMNDIQNGQLVDVYNASAHGHEMFRSTRALWDEITEREIDIKDYASAYDGKEIPPYAEEDTETAETFATATASETTETFVTLPASETTAESSDNTETQQTESPLLPSTMGSEPMIIEASVLPAETEAAEILPILLPETDSTAAPIGNAAAEAAVSDASDTSGTVLTEKPVSAERPAETTAPKETTATTPKETTVTTPKETIVTTPRQTTVTTSEETAESTVETEETEESTSTTTTAETTTATAEESTPTSAENVTKPQVTSAPAAAPANMQPSHVHTLIEETIAPSCTGVGAVRTKCSVCGAVISETSIPATGHTQITETVEATCAASGWMTVKCSVCGKILNMESIPITAHITDTITIAATCEKNGERTEKCRICGAVLSTTVIPAAGHTHVTETAEATCTENGSITVKCSVCGEIFSQEAIPAAGHTQTIETVEATCAASGWITVKCSVCGKILSMESVPVTEHTPDVTTIAATCEKDGERTEKCQICGAVLSTTVIPAAGHRYEATETKPASCVEEGEETEICTICGQEKPDSSVAIPKLPHTEVTESDGSIETVKCAVCGEIISRAALINAENFPDEVFRNYILDNFDTDESGSLSETELSRITEIAVSGKVGSLTGIELLPALKSVRATVHIEDGVIAAADIGGIDPSKVSGVSGGNYDESAGTISEIADGAEITLIYTPEGGNSVIFTLVPDETSTFWTETPEGIAVNAENFPDEVFRNYVSTNFDTDNDGELSEAEIAAVKKINVSGTYSADGGITSLKGIEYFTEITDLHCNCNSGLTKLDVSKNTALEYLVCFNTEIASLDISQNTLLKSLLCSETKIDSLDVSKNTALSNFQCSDTDITSLDLSQNTSLWLLYCDNTKMTSLDVSHNTALEFLQCRNSQLAYVDISNNPSISSCYVSDNERLITVTDGSFDTHTIDGFDPARVSDAVGAEWDEATGVFSRITEGTVKITYTYDCKGTNENKFKETFTLVPDENSTFEPKTSEGIAINAENFPDEVFRNYVSTNFDTDNNGELSEAEIAAVKTINVSGTYLSNDGGITSLKGIEYFAGITYLNCGYNSGLTELDVSRNVTLKTLYCNDTAIASLDVSQNTVLDTLYCNDTPITSLDVSNNTALGILRCENTQITMLNVSNNTVLTYLWCHGTQITSLDVSQNTELTRLECYNTPITSLDVSGATSLHILECYKIPISALDVSNNTALEYLECYATQISSLDVSKNTALKTLQCGNSRLAYVDVSNSSSISSFGANNYKHPITVVNGSFDTHTIDGFDPSRVSNVSGAEWDATTGVFSNITEGTTAITYTYDCDGAGGHNATFTLVPDEDSTFEPETPEGIAVNAVNFPDEVFRNYVSENFDTDGDGTLSEGERAAVKTINVSESYSADGGITSLKGVEYFSELTELWCSNISRPIELDVSQNTALEILYCDNTQIASLDVSNNTALNELVCHDTKITSLDVNNNPALKFLMCNNTQITLLDVSNNMALEILWCRDTPITSLDVSQNTALTDLDCGNTQITSLDVRDNTALKTLLCYGTQISSLDVSRNTALTVLECNNSQLAYVDISNNSSIPYLSASNNKHSITVIDGSFDTHTIDGFDPTRVSNVVGAEWDETTGVFSNITEGTTEITYTYDCDGRGGHNVTFALVPDETGTYALRTAADEPESRAVFLPDASDNFTPPGASDANIPTSEEGASPFGGAELFSLLPSAGLLAFAHSRKRKTAFRFAQKAEIN